MLEVGSSIEHVHVEEVYVAIMDGDAQVPARMDAERVQHNRRWLLEGWEGDRERG